MANIQPINENLIAPCGMNCGVCLAHLREKNRCPGCNFPDKDKPKTRVICKIKNCSKRKSKFCYDCEEFPCEKLEHLDKRYRTKYGMSEIDNLECIRDKGMETFLTSERQKYQKDNCLFCVHNKKYYEVLQGDK